MLFSIIIPTYNDELYISKCLDSIINQQFRDFEIIVVNDGSTDNTLSIVENYCKKTSKIKVFSIENRGVSYARNIGISHAKGEYVWFVDADDEIRLDSLEILSNCINTSEGFDIIKFDAKPVYEKKYIELKDGNINESYFNYLSSKGIIKPYEQMSFEKYLVQSGKHNRFSIYICTFLYKLEILEQFKCKFNVKYKYCEDILFQYQMINKNLSIIYLNQELYFRRLTGISAVTSPKKRLVFLENSTKFINFLIEEIGNKPFDFQIITYFIEFAMRSYLLRRASLSVEDSKWYLLNNESLETYANETTAIIKEKESLKKTFLELINDKNSV